MKEPLPEQTLVVEVEINVASEGTIDSVRVVKPSRFAFWTDTVVRAVRRTGRLPLDADGRIPPRILVTFFAR